MNKACEHSEVQDLIANCFTDAGAVMSLDISSDNPEVSKALRYLSAVMC